MSRKKLSNEAVKAQLAELEQAEKDGNIHLEPVRPSTLNKYDYLRRMWEQYKDQMEDPELRPDRKILKNFFLTHAQETKGVYSEYVTRKTMVKRVSDFGTMWKRAYGETLSKDLLADVRTYVRGDLTTRLGLKEDCRDKSTATSVDMNILLEQLWYYDSYTFVHERYRIQLALFVQILAYSASRPGAVVECSHYSKSNEALLYKDVKLFLLPSKTGGSPKLSLRVNFRLLKGRRNSKEEELEIPMKEEPEKPAECPVLLFLALAFADQAFIADDVLDHAKGPEQLLSLKIPSRKDAHEFKYCPGVEKTPVFRMPERPRARSISDYRAWTYYSATYSLRQLAIRAGYRDTINPYDIRREATSKLVKSASVHQVSKIMGHKDMAATTKFYLTKRSEVDLQSLYHGRMPENDHIEQLRSMNINRDTSAPQKLTDSEKEMVKQEFERLKLPYIPKSTAGACLPGCFHCESRRQRQSKLQSLMLKKLKEVRAEYFLHSGTFNSAEEVQPTSLSDPARLLVVGAFYGSQNQGAQSLQEARKHQTIALQGLLHICQNSSDALTEEELQKVWPVQNSITEKEYTDMELLQIVKKECSGKCRDRWGPHGWHMHCKAPWAFDWNGRFRQSYWHLIGTTHKYGKRMLTDSEVKVVKPEINLKNKPELRRMMWPQQNKDVPPENRCSDVELVRALKDELSGKCNDSWGTHRWHLHRKAPWAFDYKGYLYESHRHLLEARDANGECILTDMEILKASPRNSPIWKSLQAKDSKAPPRAGIKRGRTEVGEEPLPKAGIKRIRIKVGEEPLPKAGIKRIRIRIGGN